MANEDQLAILRQGAEAWNKWRLESSDALIDLTNANLSDVNLSSVNLSGANLNSADLANAVLTKANLSNADLTNAKVYFANLANADLTNTLLYNANFYNAELINADLSNSNLYSAQFPGCIFTEATLTGACIQDWQIGISTRLEGVHCDYIFRTYDPNKDAFSGRLPVDPKSTFAPGEFVQRFQILASALETIDITFTEGIDWRSFFESFQELRRERPDESISIQSLEFKGEAFIVRLEAKSDSDKAILETRVKQLYATQLAALEAQYEERLRLQGVHLEDARRMIEQEKQEKSTLIGIMSTMAQNQGPKYDFRGSNIGNFVETAQAGSHVQSVVHNYATEQQQKTLADTVKEIQDLLDQLAQSYPTETKTEQAAFAAKAIEKIEQDPSLKMRVVGALNASGMTLQEAVDNPLFNVVSSFLDSFLES